MSYYPNPPTPEEDPFAAKKALLISEINSDVANLQSIKLNLAYEYPQDAFYNLSKLFGDLASRYNRHRRFFGGYRKLLNSSDLYIHTVKQLINTARQISNLFVQYSRNSDAYSWADATYLIDEVIIELENVRYLCEN